MCVWFILCLDYPTRIFTRCYSLTRWVLVDTIVQWKDNKTYIVNCPNVSTMYMLYIIASLHSYLQLKAAIFSYLNRWLVLYSSIYFILTSRKNKCEKEKWKKKIRAHSLCMLTPLISVRFQEVQVFKSCLYACTLFFSIQKLLSLFHAALWSCDLMEWYIAFSFTDSLCRWLCGSWKW